MRLAVFDLGTNVFNLLLAQISNNKCDIFKVVKVGSHIGKAGFKRGSLTPEAIDSSVEAFSKMMEHITKLGGVDVIKAFATSAIRDASNGHLFVQKIRERFGVEVEVISGEREAELIYKGIRESILLYNENVLMLDIGGGSNELIIANKDKIHWKHSFPLGVIRMKEIINPSETITESELEAYISHLDSALSSFFQEVQKYKPTLLIGTSGSFDTLRELIFPLDKSTLPVMELPLEKFTLLYNRLLASNHQERLNMAGMSAMRADYMVLGVIFVNHIINKANIKELYQSSFSLKEGYMAEYAAEYVAAAQQI